MALVRDIWHHICLRLISFELFAGVKLPSSGIRFERNFKMDQWSPAIKSIFNSALFLSFLSCQHKSKWKKKSLLALERVEQLIWMQN